ncbi:hypothetical protein PYW07_003228 [Mythimna separata]|uniref:Fibronectin type-III domain-containing protein n=1 Tax=Mythimna separata TaxID=271217 RepID=A0AAD7YJB9_MYTSE|nr:hypothetical protein PYW07_003228 [Mythimna separata]
MLHNLRDYPVDKIRFYIHTDFILLSYPILSWSVEYYSLSWSLLDGHNKRQIQVKPKHEIQQESYISGLHPGTAYKVSVAAQFIDRIKDLFTLNIRTVPRIKSTMTVTEVVCADDEECVPSLKVEFTQTPKSVTQFDQYRFRLEDKDRLMMRTESQPAEAPGSSVVFSGLEPGRFYQVTMWTVSHNIFSKPVQKLAYLRLWPLKLNVINVGSSEVTLTWDKPEGNFNFFEVSYYQSDAADSSIHNFTKPDLRTNQTRITVNSLLPHTKYTFKAIVYEFVSNKLVGSKASYQTVTTLEVLPSVPSDFRVLKEKSRMLDLTWQVDPAEIKGVLRRFLLEYAPTNDPEAKITFEFPGDARGAKVAGLVSGYYYCSVRAETGAGVGPAAHLLARVALEAPQKLYGRTTTTTVTVSFRADYSPPAAGGIAMYTLVLTEQPHKNIPSILPSWFDVHALDVWPPYQVMKPYHLNSSVIEFTIGSEVCETGGLNYCNGPLKPGTKYYVKLRVITAATDNFHDSDYTIIRTDAESNRIESNPSNHTTIIISTVSVTVLILFFIVAITIYCRIKYTKPGTHHLRTCETALPFYLNLLFRDQCAKEIAEAERPYDEVYDHDHIYQEIN